jgi:type II secretory pathway pseudopilin PulG
MKRSSQSRASERGYVLLVLLLSLALLSIGLTTLIEGIDFEIKRDREEELIHRGVQYSRGVRRFIKAFGRYPNSIEELENTNNIRCLRKRYKDPITGKDFKILHLSDLPSFKPSPPVNIVRSSASQQQGVSRAVSSGGPDTEVTLAGEKSDVPSSQSDDPTKVDGAGDQTPSNAPDTSPSPQPLAHPVASTGPIRNSGQGPMIGVVSISKTTTIREFNKKNHYNEWQFVYDPSSDRGGLLTTPDQPVLQSTSQVGDGQNNQDSLRGLGANSSAGAQLGSPTR